MSVSRERSLLASIVEAATGYGEDLTAALALANSEPLLRMRKAMADLEFEAKACQREHAELHDPTARTPIRPPSQATLAAVREMRETVSGILEEGKT